MNIVFIGPRGVGKTKISRKLSKLTGQSQISTDMIAIYELGGMSIDEYIKHNDWRSFRNLEFSILFKIKDCKNIILDCGGGIIFDIDQNGDEIISERKIDLLKKIGKIIWLDDDYDYLIDKVTNDDSRPQLNSKESYRETLERRSQCYRTIADECIMVNRKSTEKTIKKILSRL